MPSGCSPTLQLIKANTLFQPIRNCSFHLVSKLETRSANWTYFITLLLFGETLHTNCSSLFSQHKLQPFKHLDHLDIVLEKRQGFALRSFCPLFYMDCTKCIQQYHCKLQGQCLANNWSKNREKATNNSSRVWRYWIKKKTFTTE